MATKVLTPFSPFAKYVRKQLKIRKAIVSNANLETSQIASSEGAPLKFSSKSKSFKRFEQKPELFYAYTQEKQCIIRMMSGVDLRPDKNSNVLEIGEEYLESFTSVKEGKKIIHGSDLAQQYILEGGTRYYKDKTHEGFRGGFTTGPEADKRKAFSYGDRNVRADAREGFGVVPMPGITDVTIQTKGENGSLREAQVNWVCFNRRQLEVLELLYMRPGYYVALEWGWNPYISNNLTRENNIYTIKNEFFKPNPLVDDLNDKIREYKEESGGNYDGFIGVVQNFTFKAREDGGYDCTTEIVAAGTAIAFLQVPKKMAEKTTTAKLENPEIEYVDTLLYYLRALKHTLLKAGDMEYLQKGGLITEPEGGAYFDAVNKMPGVLDVPSIPDSELKEGAPFLDYLKIKSNEPPIITNPISGFNLSSEDKNSQNQVSGLVDNENKLGSVPLFDPSEGITDNVAGGIQISVNTTIPESQQNRDNYARPSNEKYEDERNLWNTYVTFKREQLNKDIPSDYIKGFGDILELYNFINKISPEDKNNFSYDTIGTTNLFDYKSRFGYESILGGTILKQVIKEEDTTTGDSGFKKNIFIRWDLLCQIINHFAILGKNDEKLQSENPPTEEDPTKYRADPIVKLYPLLLELSYKNRNQRTWSNGSTLKNLDEDSSHSYVPYSPCRRVLADPSFKEGIPEDMKGSYHPLIGNSFNENICLMPHQEIFDGMFDQNTLSYYDGVEEKKNDTIKVDEVSSYVRNIPIKDMRNSVGFVYFNLNYLLETYENMRLKSVSIPVPSSDGNNIYEKNALAAASNYFTINDRFNLFDYIETIWSGVNSACANFYDFRIVTEHERPNIVKIIDRKISGEMHPNLYKFEPQGTRSITRQFYFNSKIDDDFLSMVSIAAQAPRDSNNLAELSFKAFNSNIKSRFINKEWDESIHKENVEAEMQLRKDLKKYNKLYDTLNRYQNRLKFSANSLPGSNNVYIIKSAETVTQATKLQSLRYSILNRYPLFTDKDEPHPKRGQWREGTTHDTSEIIPLQISMQLDGIAGLYPHQVFKIEKDKLPKSYNKDNVAFTITEEVQRITNSQDWIVEIKGQYIQYGTNPNHDGKNNILENLPDNKYLDLNNFPDTPNGDKVRQFLQLQSPKIHKERSYEGDSERPETTGELTSGGDISEQMANFIIDLLSTSFMANEKIEITAGNDLYHQQKLNSNSLHKIGKGVDIIFLNESGKGPFIGSAEIQPWEVEYNDYGLPIQNPNSILGNFDDKLDSFIDLLKGLKTKYPNLDWLDEYRNNNELTKGKHFHIELE